MTDYNYPNYDTASGYMTDVIRTKYIDAAIESELMPVVAHRLAQVVSLDASNSQDKPIQFWQLYSVLGRQRIINIVSRFYDNVFDDEPWFTSVFQSVGTKTRHINAQAAMWVDVMGGGQQYHGAEFRLNFHHTHNAMELMNAKGATRWVILMKATLDEADLDLTADPRVRPALNTFLSFFIDKYADDFDFAIDSDWVFGSDCQNQKYFGEINQPFIQRINFLNMTSDEIEALSADALRQELMARRIDVSQYPDKKALISKALSL